jgi:hypothetical protein
MRSNAISSDVAPMPAASRSAKTNGRRSFVDGDGRGLWARRWRDLEALYIDDLGGASALSEFQLGLVGTCATLRCELEKLEGRLSVGEAVDLDQFGRLAGHYRRICETLGIERRKRDLTPSVAEYVARISVDEKAGPT